MAGMGGREKAMMWLLLTPRICQSKNLWYLVHAQGISVYCQETSSYGNRSLCPEHAEGTPCWRVPGERGLIHCHLIDRGNNCQVVIL